MLPDPPLLVITDRRQAYRPLEQVAATAFASGGRWLSLREKDLAPAARCDLLRRLVALGRAWGAVVGVHEDIDAAIACEAGAVHLPDGASAAAARARLGGGILIGVSAHDAAGIARAAAEGADYATLSPIYPSRSKPDYGPAVGLEALAVAARAAPLPLLALGGIDAANIAATLAAGAAGIAVMGEAMRSDGDVAGLVLALRRALAGR
ncbi:MAG TPA: thiamine phosphate synthase [Stellaceae bacterium]|nr:thiamine phosphate synthase [Stellaceae bacterium]